MLLTDSLDDLRMADNKGRITLGSRYAGRRFALREGPDGSAVLTPVQVVPEGEAPMMPRRLEEGLAGLERLSDNWDGRGSLAPSRSAIVAARDALSVLHAGALARGLRWVEPHVGANERGEVVAEWWHGGRTLTVFVRSEERMDYLKAWGSSIESEMEDGELSRIADFITVVRWLYEDGAQPA